MNFRKATAVVFVLSVVPIFLAAQTSPEQFLGHAVGADGKLADYGQIQAYFQKLDQESGRVKVFTIGQTTFKKPMIMAVITSEKNMNKLDAYRQITKRLRDARDLSPEEARKLAKDGKVLVLITCSIHATEIGGSQESMELAYRLATGKTPFRADHVLEDVIVLLVPTVNPDGLQMVADWYRKYLGTKYEGGPMPWLYHPYAGHDNNRDHVAINLSESRAVARTIYHDWIPQIHDDKHQMGTKGARAFFPPFHEPLDPNMHPLAARGVDLLGATVLYDLQKQGFRGVVHGGLMDFQDWWKGTTDCTARIHNTVALFSEMASANIATPIYLDPTEIERPFTLKSRTMPDPWPGGWWRLRDIVDYELAISLSLIEAAGRHKEDFLYNFYVMNKDAIEEGTKGGPYAFVIPQDQSDYPTALRMLEIMKLGGIEINRAEEAFAAGGTTYPAGTFVVLMSQPYRSYAKSLLEQRKYPDMSQYPGGTPSTLGDNAAWSLPLQMGVTTFRIENPFPAKLAKLNEVPVSSAVLLPSSPYLVLSSAVNASYAVVLSLLRENVEIYRSRDVIQEKAIQTPAGSFLIKNSPQVQKSIPALLEKWHLAVSGLDDITAVPKAPVRNPRIGLYQSWRGSMDEGWTRYFFDDFGIPFSTLHNEDFAVSKLKNGSLKERFDVLIFADENPDVIKTGASGFGVRSQEAYPPEYQGGIGDEGVKALKAFVEKGGILVTLNNACRLALREFAIPARDVLDGVSAADFMVPKSLLRIQVDNKTPLGYGMPAEAAAIFARSHAFETRLPATGDWESRVVASYPEEKILLAGAIVGEGRIARKSAVLDVRYLKGRLILIGFHCQHRAQTHGTYKFLLNALLYPAAD